MPHKDKEQGRLYFKEYNQKNKEKISLKQSNYYQKNKEKILIRTRNFYEKNKEKINKRRKEYSQHYSKIYCQTEKGIKNSRINKWKQRGIIDEDLSAVYDYYIKQPQCMICLKEYKDSYDRCLDHDHQTGEIRYICCRYCNTNFLRE
tara:strand:- start:19 stop:459 length:441 start_codon:yes stop_codon:yes gene_type:complete